MKEIVNFYRDIMLAISYNFIVLNELSYKNRFNLSLSIKDY